MIECVECKKLVRIENERDHACYTDALLRAYKSHIDKEGLASLKSGLKIEILPNIEP